MKKVILILLFCIVSPPLPVSADFDHEHGIWDILLKKHVIMKNQDRQSLVDYTGFKNDSALFVTYLTQLSLVRQPEYDTWTKNQKLAFLINTYNAFTIKLITDHYPVDSIRDIGGMFKSPWKISFIPLLGKKRSLDEIEHTMIRQKGVFDEPRIHVALVCAAKGCPALQNQAYTGGNLNTLLETALIRFLSDTSRNRFNAGKKKFELSSIFNWYKQDFSDKYGSLNQFLMIYADTFSKSPGDLDVIKHGTFSVGYSDYDWSLNDD